MRIWITGGAGFIGSHLAERLAREGHQVGIVDNLESGRAEFVPPGVSPMYADFADPSALRFVAQAKFDLVYHLAARPRVSYSVEHPGETWEQNVAKSARLLEACRGSAGRFVFVSSSSVYGERSDLPMRESDAPSPRSPYALQKLQVEQACELFSDLYGLQTAVVRPFNVVGPRQLPGGPYGTVVPSWLEAARLRQPLRLDGDGQQRRDFTSVVDVVDVLYRVGMYPGRMTGQVFNAGSGRDVSLVELLDELRRLFPGGVQVRREPTRAGDVSRTLADVGAVRDHLGKTSWQDLGQTLREARDWFETWSTRERA